MFTGLIRDIGTIIRIDQRGDLQLEILPSDRAFPLSLGASIACNGICLTVTAIASSGAFRVALSPETLRCTTAQYWQLGAKINLEPALCMGEALGGHLVSGHVDGVATALSRTLTGEAVAWEFSAPPELACFLAQKGSVTLNGVSLTVNAVTKAAGFAVTLIPYTLHHTNLGDLSVGDTLNLEVDLLARYAARILEYRA